MYVYIVGHMARHDLHKSKHKKRVDSLCKSGAKDIYLASAASSVWMSVKLNWSIKQLTWRQLALCLSPSPSLSLELNKIQLKNAANAQEKASGEYPSRERLNVTFTHTQQVTQIVERVERGLS